MLFILINTENCHILVEIYLEARKKQRNRQVWIMPMEEQIHLEKLGSQGLSQQEWKDL